MPTEHPYEVGDLVTFVDFLGKRRQCIVIDRCPDIKNGQPGFDGVEEETPDEGCWGYDHQIVRVMRRSTSRLTVWDPA